MESLTCTVGGTYDTERVKVDQIYNLYIYICFKHRTISNVSQITNIVHSSFVRFTLYLYYK